MTLPGTGDGGGDDGGPPAAPAVGTSESTVPVPRLVRASGPLAMVLVTAAVAFASGGDLPWPLSQPAEPADVHWIVFVDDLHLDFRNTGRLRALPKAVARELVSDDDLVSLATSGPSKLLVHDARGRQALLDAATRMTGNALRAEDIARLDPQSRLEVDYRARTSLEAARGLLDSVRMSPWSRRRVMLYVSQGYTIEPGRDRHTSGDALLDDVMATAQAADVVVIVLAPAGPPMLLSRPAPALPPSIQRLLDLRTASRARLIPPSGGFSADDVEALRPELFRRINVLVGR